MNRSRLYLFAGLTSVSLAHFAVGQTPPPAPPMIVPTVESSENKLSAVREGMVLELRPDRSPLDLEAEKDKAISRHLSGAAFEKDCLLQASVSAWKEEPSEYTVALKQGEKGFEIMVLVPRTPTSEVSRRRRYETGKLKWQTEDGRLVPMTESPAYLELVSAGVPADYLQIVVDRVSRPVSAAQAARIVAVWHAFLLAPRVVVADAYGRRDGTTIGYSAEVPSVGFLTGSTWSPASELPCGRLAHLAFILGSFGRGQTTDVELERAIRAAEETLPKR